MKTFLLIFLLSMISYFGISQQNTLNERVNSFSFKLMEQLYTGNQNCFYSPFSIYGALSLTYAGAKESSKLEMEQVLEIGGNEAIHSDLKKFKNELSLERDLQVLTSNSIWIQKGLKITKDFTSNATDNYQAKVENVNFDSDKDREKARLEMNEWVNQQTKGNITNFIPQGILDESTIMVLINALYFNALWQTEFDEKMTKPDNFYLNSGDTSICSFMNTNIETSYFEDEQLQVIEIPYQNKSASMIVFLPKAGSNFNGMNFNYEFYQKSVSNFNQRQVNLFLPKFKMAINYELSETLKKMGLKTVFSPGADFSGITGSKNIFLDKILHKSVLDVSEKGTVAASATGVISMRSTKIAQESIEFKANRPFFFAIRENSKKSILFMGFLSQPN